MTRKFWPVLFLVFIFIFPDSKTVEGRDSSAGEHRISVWNRDNESRAAVDLAAFFQEQVDVFKLAGLGVCSVKDGKAPWSGGFGLADIENKRPVKPGTVFLAGSVSETVTLAAFMQLWEQEKCFQEGMKHYTLLLISP